MSKTLGNIFVEFLVDGVKGLQEQALKQAIAQAKAQQAAPPLPPPPPQNDNSADIAEVDSLADVPAGGAAFKNALIEGPLDPAAPLDAEHRGALAADVLLPADDAGVAPAAAEVEDGAALFFQVLEHPAQEEV